LIIFNDFNLLSRSAFTPGAAATGHTISTGIFRAADVPAQSVSKKITRKTKT
jgi:hypothetical protein